jgi:large repetitive protein
MKSLFSSSSRVVKVMFGSLALLTFVAFAQPHSAQAATSGGATIYNTVKVTYQSGTTTLFATANVSVSVNTVAALPTITNPTGQTVAAGVPVTYNYVVKSNSNGLDTYTTSALANAPTNISAATATSVTASVQLWGGIALGSGAGTITVPFGTTTGLTAGTSTIQIGANQYTVTGIALGTAASTNAGTGNLVAEVPATLTLTPIGAAPAITALSVPAGTQVGEFKNTALTAALTTGTPTTAGTDGTYGTTFTITTGALPVALNTTTVSVTTTVSSPRVTITKTANVANASPGGTITYTITVTNTHATASANVVTVIDPVPAYTTYVANSTRLNGITVAGDGAASPLVAGLLVDSNGGRAAGAAATGILPAGGVAVITFQVTVQ